MQRFGWLRQGKRLLFLWGSVLLFAAGLGPPGAFSAVEDPVASYLKGLTWLGHASFRFERGGVVVYFDPWRIAGAPHDADLVLISHSHYDHLSPEDVAKVATARTTIVTVQDCVEKLRQAQVPGTIRVVKPGDRLQLVGANVEAVPAYNTNKEFHKKESGWVGFILTLDGVRVYHAGDTDYIPEMSTFQAEVALLPVSGVYVMTAEEAALAVKAIAPRVSVPMHYGSIVGTEADARRFQKLAVGSVVEILERAGGA
jgi:L-ascorbate metabolism protein UlaG (beta-lactamase superfamily)